MSFWKGGDIFNVFNHSMVFVHDDLRKKGVILIEKKLHTQFNSQYHYPASERNKFEGAFYGEE